MIYNGNNFYIGSWFGSISDHDSVPGYVFIESNPTRSKLELGLCWVLLGDSTLHLLFYCHSEPISLKSDEKLLPKNKAYLFPNKIIVRVLCYLYLFPFSLEKPIHALDEQGINISVRLTLIIQWITVLTTTTQVQVHTILFSTQKKIFQKSFFNKRFFIKHSRTQISAPPPKYSYCKNK